MTFFELFGGIILFGVLLVVIPRISFAVTLGLYLHYQHGFLLVTTGWEGFSGGISFLLLMVGAVGGFIIDLKILEAIRKGVIK